MLMARHRDRYGVILTVAAGGLFMCACRSDATDANSQDAQAEIHARQMLEQFLEITDLHIGYLPYSCNPSVFESPTSSMANVAALTFECDNYHVTIARQPDSGTTPLPSRPIHPELEGHPITWRAKVGVVLSVIAPDAPPATAFRIANGLALNESNTP
jgi:hypothetical protein